MPLIVTFDLISLLASLTALAILFVGWRRIPGREVKLFIAGLLISNSFYVFFLALEWSGITQALDPFEDIIGALIPMWWAFIFYAFILGGRTSDLRKSEEQYRLLADNSIDCIWVVDLDLNFKYINPAIEQMLGFNPQEWIGSNVADHADPKNLEILKNAAARMMQNMPETPGINFEAEMLDKNGRMVPLEISGKLVLDENGSPASLQGITRDITERKMAEEALRESEERFRTLVEASSDWIWEVDRNGVYTYSSPKIKDVLGFEPQDMLGKTAFDLMTAEEAMCNSTLFRDALRNGQPLIGLENTTIHKDGHHVVLETNGVPIFDEDGKIVGYRGIDRDITERKQVEEEREGLIGKLEVQNAELERFTYTVSHDLKSPLITINGFVGVLRDDLQKGNATAVQHDLSRISAAADKMGHLLKELLELSRIGRLVNPPVNVPLQELAHKAIDLAHGQIEQRGVQVDVMPDLPVVYGDKLRLLEVLQNLIDNAVKYMGDQAQPRIEIGSRRDGVETVCYVRDNGIGIESSYMEKVFGLFEQLDQKAEGSGIGLAVVKRILEVHGGRIWVESEGSGHGSTFFFTLPAKKSTS